MFNEALSDLNEIMEEIFVNQLPNNELPLYLNTLSEKATEILLKRIKGGLSCLP
jgi:hypothetical protein